MRNSATLVLVIMISGCTASGNLFTGGRDSSPRVGRSASETLLDGQGLGVYLQVMRDLIDGDAVTQAEVFQTVSTDAAGAATTTNRLKLALALSIPGHPNSNDEHAQQELSALLASSELLLPEERVLAAVQLRDVERRLVLDMEATQSRISADQLIERQNSDAAQRIGALEDENRQLRQQLEEAQTTLEEITNIERSIRERESGAN